MVDPKRALVSLAVGREVVRRAVAALAPAGIPVLPLKGVWLQTCVYSAMEPRVITDVDLLVPEEQFEPAIARLELARFRAGSGNVSERTLAHPELALAIDLHRRLFTRGAFRLPTAAMFRRATSDTTAFGVEVQLPDPRDAFAHLVGHFVKSRTRIDDRTRLADFIVIADRCGVEPVDLAHHLQATGMARAARYVLHELAYRQSLPFFETLLRALPEDPFGAQLVGFARALDDGPLAALKLAPLKGFMLDASLRQGAQALVLRALDRRHDRLER